jgi:hypothetical protein
MAQWAWDTHELFPRTQRTLHAARARGNTGSGDTTTMTSTTANEQRALLSTPSTLASPSLEPSGTLARSTPADDAAAGIETLPPHLLEQLRVALLASLTDRSQVLTEKSFAFWSHETRLSSDTAARLRATLSSLWSPANEDGWLNYSTRLVLLLARKAPVYESQPLCKPLDAATKEAVAIDTNPGHMTNQMVPLFQPSFNFGSLGSVSASLAPDAYMPEGAVQATAAPLFSLTLDQGGGMTIGAGYMASGATSASLGDGVSGGGGGGGATSTTVDGASSPHRHAWDNRQRMAALRSPRSAATSSSNSQTSSASLSSSVMHAPRRFRHTSVSSATSRGVQRAAFQRRRKQAWSERLKVARFVFSPIVSSYLIVLFVW